MEVSKDIIFVFKTSYTLIISIIMNNALINNNYGSIQRHYFRLQNLLGHAKGTLRNLLIIWARALKKVRQPSCRPQSAELTKDMSGNARIK
jgi:hypothetical protein